MKAATRKATGRAIREWLNPRGKMSGQDICDALKVDEVDVHHAEHDGYIISVKPAHGGGGAWYRANFSAWD